MITSRNLILLLSILLLSSASVNADDGGISFGGSPKLLKGHKSVSMKDEVIKINVKEEVIKVECQFVFHNDGPATTVRMGFPDQGLGAQEPYQGDPVPKKNIHGTFLSYDSWVDGKKVSTKVEPQEDRSVFWHTKTVTFPAHKDCIIRDVYTLPPGAQVTTDEGLYHQTYYILHTASSWKGPIGRAQIDVTFAPDAFKGQLVPRLRSTFKDQDLDHVNWPKLPTGIVIYESSIKPTVNGRTMSFVASNLQASQKDDIHLFFGYRKLKLNF